MRSSSIALVFLALFVATPAAAQRHGAAAGPLTPRPLTHQGSPPAQVGTPRGQGEITLVSPGTGARLPLRHRFSPGQREELRLRIQMNMQIAMGDRDANVSAPTMVMDLDLGPTEVTPEGHLRYTYRVTEVTTQGGDEQARAQVGQAIAGLRGAHGTAVLDDRGRVLDFEYELADGADPRLRQQGNSLRDAMTQLLPRFPEEAIGVGAVWRIRDELRLPNMAVGMFTEYRLRSRQGDVVELQMRVRSDDAAVRDLPANAQLDISGTGRTRFVLGSLETRSRSQSTAEIGMAGPNGRMRIHMETRNQVAPR
jgi:hypothetical protein